MIGNAIGMTIAATFTAGCIVIHEFRHQPRALTAVLGLIVVCLGAFVALASMSVEAAKDGSLAHSTAPSVKR